MKTKTFKSEFDKRVSVSILCDDDILYSFFEPVFEEYGFGVVDTKSKSVFIDGMKGLSKAETKWIEAHEVAHILLKHKGERNPTDEWEADSLAHRLLSESGYKRAAGLVRTHSMERHNKRI